MKVTGQQLWRAIAAQDEERHGADQACFDLVDPNLSDFLFDGRMNLDRVAEILSDILSEPS